MARSRCASTQFVRLKGIGAADEVRPGLRTGARRIFEPRSLRGQSAPPGATADGADRAYRPTMDHPSPIVRDLKLRDIMREEVLTATTSEAATAAWSRMRAAGVDHVVVVHDDGKIVGVLSLHDLSGPRGGFRRRMGRKVGDLMRPDARTSTPDTSVARAARLMRQYRIGCLPVVRRGRLAGLVTTWDLLRLLAESPRKGAQRA